MAIFYADASALVKLVLDEPESPALRAFLVDADLVSCDLVLTEVPRAIRRAMSVRPTSEGPASEGPASDRPASVGSASVGSASVGSASVGSASVGSASVGPASGGPGSDETVLLTRAAELFDAVAMLPLDRAVLMAAGALTEPALRALDAIHVAAAVDVLPLDGFVTYDARQAAAARLAGLRTVAPGT